MFSPWTLQLAVQFISSMYKPYNSSYETVLSFWNIVVLRTRWIKPCHVTDLWKASEQHCYVILFIFWPAYCGSNFRSLEQMEWSVNILWQTNEQYFHAVAFAFCDGVVLTFYSMDWSNHALWPFFAKLLNCTFIWCCLFCDTAWF